MDWCSVGRAECRGVVGSGDVDGGVTMTRSRKGGGGVRRAANLVFSQLTDIMASAVVASH